ncbi:MAG: hypothetical protein ACERKO_10920 [Acetanaerobacterium sp.]
MKQNNLHTLRLFSPLFPKAYQRNEYGDYDNEPEGITSSEVCNYEDEILAAIRRERLPDEGKHGLAIYLDNELLKNKVYSMNPTVERWDGKLWGVLEVQTYGELTDPELDALKSEWCGQESDGWGEGFEQRPIKTPEGELYISFWDSGNDFFIKTEEKLKNQQSQGFGMQMG